MVSLHIITLDVHKYIFLYRSSSTYKWSMFLVACLYVIQKAQKSNITSIHTECCTQHCIKNICTVHL